MKSLQALFLLVSLTAAAAPPVLVAYRDKPPYSYTENGKPAGFLLERTVEIFRRAEVSAVYMEIPPKRITADIQANHRPVCSPSWYKLPEREQFAQFSLAIHQDKPQVVLAGPHAAAAIRKIKSLKTLLGDGTLTLGALEGVSYGPELDKAIASMPKPPMRSVVTPMQLVRMIAARRADYMLIDQEDLAYLDRQGEVAANGMVRIDFPDSPPGLKRYLMCSKQVDAATMARLDKAIRQLLPGLNP